MQQSTPTPQRAGTHPRSVLLFIALVAFTVGFDLWFKSWAFSHVADQPLILDRDPADGTTLVQIRDTSGELVTQQRARPSEPSSAIPYHDGITIIPHVFSLRLTINTGAVFGLGKGKQWVFVIVSIVAVVVISLVFARSDAKSGWLHITLALILGGALGNMYDRVLYNGVRDMCLLFPGVKLPFGLAWPGGAYEVYPWIFNIADAALVVGVIVLLIFTWRTDTRRPADSPAPG